MNNDVLAEDEVRSIYANYWREEFMLVLWGVEDISRLKHKREPDFDYIRNGVFQFYRWAIDNRNARLKYRNIHSLWDGAEVQNLDEGLKQWWESFPKTIKDTNISEPEEMPFYDFHHWLMCRSDYFIEWDLDSPPNKFGDVVLNCVRLD